MMNVVKDGSEFSLLDLKDYSEMFDEDLSGCTLIELVSKYQENLRETRPRDRSCGPLIHQLTQFENCNLAEGHITLMPSYVTDKFYGMFVRFITNQGLKAKTTKMYCHKLKLALEYGSEHKVSLSSTYKRIPKIKTEDSNKIALSYTEVIMLASFDFRAHKGKTRLDLLENFEKTRDHFVLSCMLGQRHSDMNEISIEHFNGTEFHICSKKTGAKAVVDMENLPMSPMLLMEILEKYKYQPPYCRSNSVFNRKLHAMLKFIGGHFADKVVIEGHDATGNMTRERKPLYEIITSHTARRTFATFIATFLNKPVFEIQEATGHKDPRSVNTYIKNRKSIRV